jgi:predicted CXXCH cytochrome family protein
VENICFRCHVNKKTWLQKSHIHGPVGTGDCTVCHNPHGDVERFQLWATGKDELCVACHTDKKNLVSGKKPVHYVHGILNGIGCIACHDPHATDNPFQLYKPTNDLCTGATSLKASPEAIRGRPPVSGAKDPRRPERVFTCTSCHNPHGSDLNSADRRYSGGHICNQCHY